MVELVVKKDELWHHSLQPINMMYIRIPDNGYTVQCTLVGFVLRYKSNVTCISTKKHGKMQYSNDYRPTIYVACASCVRVG